MSMGEIYVKAVDGNWYADPVIKGERCHIIFDEDDPPEFVMHTTDRGEAMQVLQALAVVHGLKIANVEKATGGNGGSYRNINGKQAPSVSIFFRLLSRIPVPTGQQPATKPNGTFFDPENAT